MCLGGGADQSEKRKQRERPAKARTLEDDRGLRDESASLEKKWALARDRFDLAIGVVDDPLARFRMQSRRLVPERPGVEFVSLQIAIRQGIVLKEKGLLVHREI